MIIVMSLVIAAGVSDIVANLRLKREYIEGIVHCIEKNMNRRLHV